MSQPKGKIIHLAYRDAKTPPRFLCHSKPSEKFVKPMVLKSGKTNCLYCKKRYKAITRMIATKGVEWVCEGRWVPLESRQYKDAETKLI
ncbi:MAG: hypothetical protein EBZ49_00240 [Proteobacteria bacterium]|nr:hypothetical protein [Pseudomonadota bacterium]